MRLVEEHGLPRIGRFGLKDRAVWFLLHTMGPWLHPTDLPPLLGAGGFGPPNATSSETQKGPPKEAGPPRRGRDREP